MIDYFKISRVFLYLIPLGVYIVLTNSLFPFIVGKYAWFRALTDLAFIFFLLGILLAPQDVKRLKIFERLSALAKNPLAVAVGIFTIIFLLAGFFGIDPSFSFWSNFERGEGGLQILHLSLFFILLAVLMKEEENWRTLFWFALAGGALMALYGIAAGLGLNGYIGGKFSDSGFRFAGSIGNPAYVAAYAIFMMFYAAYLAVSYYKKVSTWAVSIGGRTFILGFFVFPLALIAGFFVVFLLAATRGAFMGLAAAILAALAYLGLSVKSWRKWFLISAAAVVILLSAGVYFKDEPFIQKLPFARIFDISFSAKTWQDRTYIWNMAWEGFKARPILGWGPESFLNVFDRHFDTRYFNPKEGFGAWFDRAHSIYFDYLVETGVLGLLSYLGIFAAFAWLFGKSHKRQTDGASLGFRLLAVNALMIMAPVAYLVQGIVLFDVWPIYLNVFMFLAFAVYKFNFEALETRETRDLQKNKRI